MSDLRHLDELTKEPWFKQPWVILGTGPSLNNFDYENWKDYNIAAIYDAAFACEKVRVTFASDHWWGKTDHHAYFDRSEYVATRIINSEIPPFENVRYWEYDCDVEQLGGRRLFPEVRTYPCSNTSSFIVYWLCFHGVKEIYTCGIDGGWGVADVVRDVYREQATPDRGWHPDRENEGVYGHASGHGVTLIKI